MCVYLVVCVHLVLCLCVCVAACVRSFVCVSVCMCVYLVVCDLETSQRGGYFRVWLFRHRIQIYNGYKQSIVVRQNNKPIKYKEGHFVWSCMESCVAVGRQFVVWRVVWRVMWRWACSLLCGDLCGGGQAACCVERCLAGRMNGDRVITTRWAGSLSCGELSVRWNVCLSRELSP